MTDEEEPSCSICGELYDDPIMFWNNHLVTTSCGPLIKKRMETNNQQLPPPTMDEIRATCTVRLHDSRLFCCICQETFPKMPLSWYHVQTSALHQRVVMWEDRTRAQLLSPTGDDGASFQAKERRTDPLFVEYQKTLPVVQQKALAFLRKQYPYQENKDDGCMTDDDVDDCDDDDHNSAVPCVSRKRPRGESDDGDALSLSKDAIEAMSYLAPPLFLKQGQIAVDPFPWYALGDSFRSPFQMPPRLGRTGQRLDWFEESAPEGISNRELAEETKQRLLTLRVVEKSQEAPLKVNDRWCDVCGKVFNESGWHAHMNDLSHRKVWDSDRWERTPNPATIIDETPPPPPATTSAASKSVPQVVKAPTPSAVKVPLSAPIRIAMNPPKVAPSSSLPASSHPTNTSVRPLTTPPPSSTIEQRKVLSQTVVQRPIRPPNAPPNPLPARSSTAPQPSASSTSTATRAPAPVPPPPPPQLRAKAVAQPPLPPLPSTKRPIASPFSGITKMPPASAAAPVAPTPSAVPTPALVGSVRCTDCGLLYPNTTDGRALHMISVKHQDALNQQRQNQELLNSGLKPADLLRPGEEKYVRVLGNTFSYICTLCSVQVQGHETWLKHAGGGNHQQKWDAALQRERMASMPLPSPSPGAAAPAMYPQPPAPSQPSFSMSSIPGVHSSEHNTLTAPAASQMSGFYLRPPGAPPVAPPPQQQQRNVVEPPQAPYTGNEYSAVHDVPHYRNNPAPTSDRYAEREPHRYEEVDRGDRYRQQQREQPLESRDRRDYYDDPQRYRDSRDSTSYSTSRSGGSAGGYERSPTTTTTYHHHHVEHDRGSKRFEEDVYYRRRAEESDRSHVGSSSSAILPPPPAAAGSTHSSSHQPTTDTHRRYAAPSPAPPPSSRGPPLASAPLSSASSSSSAHHQLMPPPPGMDEEEEEDAPTGSWSMNSLPGVKGSEANKLTGGVLRKKNGKVIEKVTPKYVATAKGAPPAAGYLRPPGK